MGINDQLLPEDENFSAPDWLAATDGSGDYSAPPYHFHYLAFNPTLSLNTSASEYSAYPLKTGGAMEVVSTSDLYHPTAGAPGGAMPVALTDTTAASQDKLRAFLCRSEDVANYDDLSVEVVFGIEQIAGVTTGAATLGRQGSGPTPQGVRRIAESTDLTDDDNATLNFEDNAKAGYTGPTGPYEPISPLPAFNGWLGSGVIVRAGGGHPEVAEDASGRYSVSGVSGYIFLAYPVKNGSNIDLQMKLYRQIHGGSGNVGVPTLLATHVEANGYSLIRFRERLRLRLEVDTNGSGNVELKAYIFPIKHGSHHDEHQVFKASDWSNETILAGPSGDASVSTSTGVVTDSGSNKIATFADKTFGWIMGRDRTLDLHPWTGDHTLANVTEGIYRVTVRSGGSTIRYNDRFQRTSLGSNIVTETVDAPVFGIFNSGSRAPGLWVHDHEAQTYGSGDLKVAQLMLWTDGTTDTTSPNDYVQTYIDPTPASGDLAGKVARFYTYKRPSTQVFNHYRTITCVGPDDSTSGEANKFAVGVAVRGQIGQRYVDVVGFFAYYTTDGAGAQTSLRFAIARLQGDYGDDLVGSIISNGTEIAALQKQASGAAIPSGFDMPGVSHTLGLKVEAYSKGTNPSTAAEYTAFFDGTAITFDTFNFNASIDSSDVVTHPAPPASTTQGTSEAFFWYSDLDAIDGSSDANYTLPRWSAWTQGSVDPDPVDDGDGAATIAVQDEGTGTVNLSTAIQHVDWAIRVSYERPRFDIEFESGHRYTSPRWGNARRSITAQASNVSKATMDLIVAFYNARQGVQDPFLFDFPMPASRTDPSLTTITVVFTNQDGLQYERVAEGVYNVSLNMVEIL